MFDKVGYTCTCIIKRLKGYEEAPFAKFIEIRSLRKRLVSQPEDVQCYETFWNHDKDAEKVKVKVGIFNYKEIK